MTIQAVLELLAPNDDYIWRRHLVWTSDENSLWSKARFASCIIRLSKEAAVQAEEIFSIMTKFEKKTHPFANGKNICHSMWKTFWRLEQIQSKLLYRLMEWPVLNKWIWKWLKEITFANVFFPLSIFSIVEEIISASF